MEKITDFGKNLRLLRESAGIGQVKLAADLGVSKGIISLWENNKREPTLSYLVALANYFDVTIDYLVGLE
jgi:transcriptional regulator with XRE-family HTH domain